MINKKDMIELMIIEVEDDYKSSMRKFYTSMHRDEFNDTIKEVFNECVTILNNYYTIKK